MHKGFAFDRSSKLLAEQGPGTLACNALLCRDQDFAALHLLAKGYSKKYQQAWLMHMVGGDAGVVSSVLVGAGGAVELTGTLKGQTIFASVSVPLALPRPIGTEAPRPGRVGVEGVAGIEGGAGVEVGPGVFVPPEDPQAPGKPKSRFKSCGPYVV